MYLEDRLRAPRFRAGKYSLFRLSYPFLPSKHPKNSCLEDGICTNRAATQACPLICLCLKTVLGTRGLDSQYWYKNTNYSPVDSLFGLRDGYGGLRFLHRAAGDRDKV